MTALYPRPAPISVLVVDDEPDVRSALVRLLKRHARLHGRVLEAIEHEDAASALATLRAGRVDVLITDFQLRPGDSIDGLVAAAHEPFGPALCALVSGDHSVALRDSLIRFNMAGGHRFQFLEKPFGERSTLDLFLKIMIAVEARPLPHPLATWIDRFQAEHSAERRLRLIAVLVEVTLRLALAILGAASEDAAPRPSPSRVNGLGFGAALGLLTRMRDRAERIPDAHLRRELVQFCYGDADTRGFIDVARKVKTVRDQILAHGYALDPAAYTDMLTDVEPAAVAWMTRMRCFAGWPMLSPVRFDWGTGDDIAYTSTLLMGSHPTVIDHQTAARLRRQHVYLRLSQDGYLDLHPWFSYRNCPTCREHRVFVLDSIGGGQANAKAFCNHTVPHDAAEVDAAYGRLVGSIPLDGPAT